jgi:serine/threonine protein kinase
LDQLTTAPSIKEIQLDNKKILGRGGYSQVFEGTWKNNQVAVKRINLSKVVGHKQEEEELALQKLDHPNIIKLLHVESDNTFR